MHLVWSNSIKRRVASMKAPTVVWSNSIKIRVASMNAPSMVKWLEYVGGCYVDRKNRVNKLGG